jgi:acyl-CoA dehydrogenase
MEDTIPNKELVYRDRVKKFVEEELNPISLQVETSGEIPEVIVEKMRELGLFGLSIPKEFGGLRLSTLGEILVGAVANVKET